jgi:hypothetical protein
VQTITATAGRQPAHPKPASGALICLGGGRTLLPNPRNETPAAGQALAARRRDTMARFAGGDADMQNAVYRLAADWGH